jgi:hypothetical protein
MTWYSWQIVQQQSLTSWISIRWWWGPLCTRPTCLVGFFLNFATVSHWNNIPWIDMSPHLDTLSWFRPNQSLQYHLNDACLANQFYSVWFDQIGAWTHDLPPSRPVHKLPFGSKCHELFVILYSIFANLSDGPGQYTVILTGSLTKTNRENINVKHNIYQLWTFYEVNVYIYGPVRIILTEDEDRGRSPRSMSEVNIIITGPYISYWQS